MDFEYLLDKYEKSIYNLILRLVDNPEEAADLTQDVFISAYRNATSFRNDSSEYTWLYRIAVNHCKNRFKQMFRQKTKETVSLNEIEGCYESSEPLAAAKVSTPWESLDNKELRRHIERAIISLPYDYKVLIILRDMQGLSYLEIADILGVSSNVIRTKLARARAALRNILEPYIKQ